VISERGSRTGLKHIEISEGTSRLYIADGGGQDTLTRLEARELQKYIEIHKLNAQCFLWGPDSIKIINYVGVIQLSTVLIEILPKVSSSAKPREVLLNMLIISRYLDVDYSALTNLQLTKKNLFEIFGYIFALKLKQELFYGVFSTYQECQDNLSFQKGKILFSRQINNAIRNIPKAYCSYHEFTTDNTMNRVFKFVIRLLARNIETAKTIDLLRYCLLNLQEVSDVTLNITDTENVFFDRTNRRFYPAFSLAKIFLANYSPLSAAGGYFTFSILFKMNDLFERYVYEIARKTLHSYKVQRQHQVFKLLINEKTQRGVYQLIPDIVVENESTQVIIDTKWKIISSDYFRHGVKREDYFQMYVYLTRYTDAKAAILLYPYNKSIKDDPGCLLESYYLECNEAKKLKVYSIGWESEKDTVREIRNIVEDLLRDN
jgi:McrBC 5-methylcytosine restriction system component